MQPGALIDYRLRFRGIPLRWRSEITVWEPPHRFADVAAARALSPLGARARLRGGRRRDAGARPRALRRAGGRLIDRLFVARDVEAIFAYRRRALEAALAGHEATG